MSSLRWFSTASTLFRQDSCHPTNAACSLTSPELEEKIIYNAFHCSTSHWFPFTEMEDYGCFMKAKKIKSPFTLEQTHSQL